jgi:hypothetical protein
MAKRSTIESDLHTHKQTQTHFRQIAKNEEQRPSKDTLERVLGEHLLYFYGMAGTFEVHVLSYDPMRHCAILCVDRRFVYKPPFVYIHHMKCFLINVYIIYIYIYTPIHCSKVALLLNALTFFPPNDKYKSNISVLRTIRQSPYLHSLRSSSRDFFLQMLNL